MIKANKKTIEKEISFSGKALQTGQEVKVTCKPAGGDSGIIFRRVDLENRPEFKLGFTALDETGVRRTVVGKGAAAVQTVEHFLAALWGLEIDNIAIEIEGSELPALDGSSAGFLSILKEAGTVEQEAPRVFIKIKEPEEIKEKDSSITVFPADSFSVSYLIDYKIKSIGRQVFQIELDKDSFEKEIAPARTFCLRREALILKMMGLGKGANLKNTLVMGRSGPMGTTLRFPDEPVRHKVLDLVGDFYVLGKPVLGRVVAERSGHRLNAMMVKKIYEKYCRKGECL